MLRQLRQNQWDVVILVVGVAVLVHVQVVVWDVKVHVLEVVKVFAVETVRVVVLVAVVMDVEVQVYTKVNMKEAKIWQSGIAKDITFIVTKDCQLACKYCYLVGKNTEERMS